MEWLVIAGTASSLLIAIPVLWRTVVLPGAKRVAEKSTTEPILQELAKTTPPIVVQLAVIRDELHQMNQRLATIERRSP